MNENYIVEEGYESGGDYDTWQYREKNFDTFDEAIDYIAKLKIENLGKSYVYVEFARLYLEVEELVTTVNGVTEPRTVRIILLRSDYKPAVDAQVEKVIAKRNIEKEASKLRRKEKARENKEKKQKQAVLENIEAISTIFD
jgi:vacuolar-type H+-ATPase subunit I/STV1